MKYNGWKLDRSETYRNVSGNRAIPVSSIIHRVSIFFLFLSVLVQVAIAQASIEPAILLTVKEQAWLGAHPDIHLAYPSGHEPTLMKRTDGKPVGILVGFGVGPR